MSPEFNTEEYFEIEELLDKRDVDGEVEYMVKWKGYGPKFNTWEPERDLKIDAPLTVQEYENRKKKEELNILKCNTSPSSSQSCGVGSSTRSLRKRLRSARGDKESPSRQLKQSKIAKTKDKLVIPTLSPKKKQKREGNERMQASGHENEEPHIVGITTDGGGNPRVVVKEDEEVKVVSLREAFLRAGWNLTTWFASRLRFPS